MSEQAVVTVWVNGTRVQLPEGAMVSAALLNAGVLCRTSVGGEPRTAVCGMGICFECRAIVDGIAASPYLSDGLCLEGMRLVRSQP